MAQVDGTFTISVLGEKGVVYYGECNTLFVPSENDMIAILAYHTPMIMKLGKGDVAIKTGREKRTLTVITGGLLYVGNNEVTVLVNL